MTSATPRKVLVLDHTAALGGGELALVRLLGSVDRSRFAPSVVLFADGPLRERLEALGIEVSVLPLPGHAAGLSRHDLLGAEGARAAAAFTRHAQALRRLVREVAPDLVMANSLKAGVLGGPIVRSLRIPFVWYLRDRLSADYLPAPVAAATRLLLRTVSTEVIANSRATLATAGPLGSRGHVAYSGLPEDTFADSVRQLRRLATSSAPTRRRPPVVAILGRVSPTKGQHVFLRAAAAVRRTGIEARFRIIGAPLFGEEEYAGGLPVLAERLGLTDVVEFAGWVDDPMTALREVNVLVHASPVPEPFGQVVVQALAAGVPVIATDAGGIPEILDPHGGAVRHGRVRRAPYGQLVPPGDDAALAEAIGWVLTDPDAALDLAEAALASARARFGLAEATASVEAAWEQAIAAGPGRRTGERRRRAPRPAATPSSARG